ncbi:MAG: histidine phosphatase family protein [Acidimicrobiales bacterium]
MSLLRYISHAEVVIDADVPVPQWGLTDHGRARVEAMLDQPWVPAIGRVITSAETKAVETGTILGDRLGLTIEVRADTGETDRSSTGYVPRAEHDRLSEQFFGHPERPAQGWERAIDAQHRIVAAVADLLDDNAGLDVAVVGHGGVGTLLWCHLAGLAIDARHDQDGAGHYFTFDRRPAQVVHPWRPIDDLEVAGRS